MIEFTKNQQEKIINFISEEEQLEVTIASDQVLFYYGTEENDYCIMPFNTSEGIMALLFLRNLDDEDTCIFRKENGNATYFLRGEIKNKFKEIIEKFFELFEIINSLEITDYNPGYIHNFDF